MKRTKASLVAAMAAGLAAAVAAQAKEADPKNPPEQLRDAKAPKIDAKADTLLRRMSADLAKLKSFTVDTEHVTEVVTTDNQKLQMLASSTLAVHRPNMLRSDRKGPLGDVTLFYDGKNLTVYGKRDNLYATVPAPNTLDKMIDFARNELDLDAPAADLLYSDPYKILMEDVVSAQYVDDAVIAGHVCKHLAYHGNETDWEIWIEDATPALPCRFVITTKDVKGWPQYSVEMTNWKTTGFVPESEFTFTPPKDAGKIDFIGVSKAQKKAGGK